MKPDAIGECSICGVERLARELAPYFFDEVLGHACEAEACRTAARRELRRTDRLHDYRRRGAAA